MSPREATFDWNCAVGRGREFCAAVSMYPSQGKSVLIYNPDHRSRYGMYGQLILVRVVQLFEALGPICYDVREVRGT